MDHPKWKCRRRNWVVVLLECLARPNLFVLQVWAVERSLLLCHYHQLENYTLVIYIPIDKLKSILLVPVIDDAAEDAFCLLITEVLLDESVSALPDEGSCQVLDGLEDNGRIVIAFFCILICFFQLNIVSIDNLSRHTCSIRLSAEEN